METDTALSPGDFERMLADAIETEDEDRIADVFAGIPRARLEFTGRCYAAAICAGLVRTALLFGTNGFHLDVTDEPAIRHMIENTGGDTRGLRGFLNDYRYCRAQRTYYLPVIQAKASYGPLAALLDENVGLTEADKHELLVLAVRKDKADIARLLCDHGADLTDEGNGSVPESLRRNTETTDDEDPWSTAASPHHNTETLTFILERMGERKCRIRADWFKLYFRETDFAFHLGLLVLHSSGELCEDIGATMATLAQAGQSQALNHLLTWPEATVDDARAALERAREAGHVESAALLMNYLAAHDNPVEALSW